MPKKTETRYPDGNPKTQFGIKKPPMWYTPMRAVYQTAVVHLQGALKYGHFNWRDDPVTMSTYMDAAQRHIAAFKEGENYALDTGLHHLAHATACLNIIMDAQLHGTMTDDRHGQSSDMETFMQQMEEAVKKVYDDWGPDSEWAKKQKQKKG